MQRTLPSVVIPLALALTLALGTFVLSATAQEHDEHDESVAHNEEMSHDEHGRVEKMRTLIAVLTQLIEVLKQAKAVGLRLDTAHHQQHSDHAHSADGDTLDVWIEIHSHRTHAHVKEPGKPLDTFFLDDLAYAEGDAIISAIADRTGLPEHDIAAVIRFPSSEVDEQGDSVGESVRRHAADDEHHDEHEEQDLAGIHIMGDGTVMLGSGDVLEDATVTDDGMIMLADGTLIEPEYDLR